MTSNKNQWIGLREILQENPMIFMGKYMVSCRFSLKPIHWSNKNPLGEDVDAHRACIADVSQALLCGAFAQGERFDNVQVLYIVSKGRVFFSGGGLSEAPRKWVCLKIGNTPKPNGFADHYPY